MITLKVSSGPDREKKTSIYKFMYLFIFISYCLLSEKFLLIDWLSQTFYFNNLNTWQNNFLKSEKLTLILEISLVAIFIRARNEEESCWKGEHVLEKKSLSWWLGKKKTWWEEREYNKRPRSSVRDICPLSSS